VPASFAEDPGASGISLSYIHLLAGEMQHASGDQSWASGRRLELQFRDYYFSQATHHPFYELGFLLENHEGEVGGVKVEAETIGLKAAIGSAIPLWHDREHHAGLAPQFAVHVGRMTLDSSAAAARVSDEATRYGASLGIDLWATFAGSMTVGTGPFVSYWRTDEIDAVNSAGATVHAAASGWDVGARMLIGVIF
jgi:hypothetical protein